MVERADTDAQIRLQQVCEHNSKDPALQIDHSAAQTVFK
jgi:hypothetical protein